MNEEKGCALSRRRNRRLTPEQRQKMMKDSQFPPMQQAGVRDGETGYDNTPANRLKDEGIRQLPPPGFPNAGSMADAIATAPKAPSTGEVAVKLDEVLAAKVVEAAVSDTPTTAPHAELTAENWADGWKLADVGSTAPKTLGEQAQEQLIDQLVEQAAIELGMSLAKHAPAIPGLDIDDVIAEGEDRKETQAFQEVALKTMARDVQEPMIETPVPVPAPWPVDREKVKELQNTLLAAYVETYDKVLPPNLKEVSDEPQEHSKD